MTARHDLDLPAWGPYGKRYAGISHLADPRTGARFDLAVMPGHFRRNVLVPALTHDSGVLPLAAAADLSCHAWRLPLPGDEAVHVDARFAAVDGAEDARLLTCELVNGTDAPQLLALHLVTALELPVPGGHLLHGTDQRLPTAPPRPARLEAPAAVRWLDALDYRELVPGRPGPRDGLVPDLLRRGEAVDPDFIGGRGLGGGRNQPFGLHGDRVVYHLVVPEDLADGVLALRCRTAPGAVSRLRFAGALAGELAVTGDGRFGWHPLTPVALAAGTQAFTLTVAGEAMLELDGFAWGPAAAVAAAAAVRDPMPVDPALERLDDRALLLRYPDATAPYGLAWETPAARVREFRCAELDAILPRSLHNHVHHAFVGSGAGHFTDVVLEPIAVAPGARTTVRALVARGDGELLARRLRTFLAEPAALRPSARAVPLHLDANPAGQAHRAGQERLAATVLTNIVYPVRARDGWIRHATPGRAWDSLYTWDSGFVGLGLAELAPRLAADCLRAYLTEPDDPHAAFVHHGSPVPVQFLLAQELGNRTGDRELLAWCLPRLLRYHRFLAGREGGSTTRNLASNLLRPWDYFYNSGGWDDYPPQRRVHAAGLADRVTPVVTTALAIRTARCLLALGILLGEEAARAELEEDVAVLTAALERHAWDDASGYYGYVVHDADGRPGDILRDADGGNANRGLDGLAPLLAGTVAPERLARLAEHLFDPAGVWCPHGLSTVDRRSPAYRDDGYWNGAVWLPHQWFHWKACLDRGDIDGARRIALTALALWSAEVDRSGRCCEHFMIATGRDAGWHHFGGLSTPALAWFGALYRPPRLTGGFDCWMETLKAEGDRLRATLLLTGPAGRRAAVLATLAEGAEPVATFDGAPVGITAVVPGCWAIDLPAAGRGELVITRSTTAGTATRGLARC